MRSGLGPGPRSTRSSDRGFAARCRSGSPPRPGRHLFHEAEGSVPRSGRRGRRRVLRVRRRRPQRRRHHDTSAESTTTTTTTTPDCRRFELRGTLVSAGASSFSIKVVKANHASAGAVGATVTVAVTPDTRVVVDRPRTLSGPNPNDWAWINGKRCGGDAGTLHRPERALRGAQPHGRRALAGPDDQQVTSWHKPGRGRRQPAPTWYLAEAAQRAPRRVLAAGGTPPLSWRVAPHVRTLLHARPFSCFAAAHLIATSKGGCSTWPSRS